MTIADQIAEIIRRVDGSHTLGAGELGEHIAQELVASGVVQATSEEDLNVTKAGILVKPGQIWQDCDKRAVISSVKVLEVNAGKARIERGGAGGRQTTISVKRMHSSSTGFVLVRDV